MSIWSSLKDGISKGITKFTSEGLPALGERALEKVIGVDTPMGIGDSREGRERSANANAIEKRTFGISNWNPFASDNKPTQEGQGLFRRLIGDIPVTAQTDPKMLYMAGAAIVGLFVLIFVLKKK